MNIREHTIPEEEIRLSNTFAQELPVRIEEIEKLWNKSQVEKDIKTLRELHYSVHKLVSSSSVWGKPELSFETRTLEQSIKSWLQKDVLLDTMQLTEVSQKISKLKKFSAAQKPTLSEDTATEISDSKLFLNIHASNQIFVVEEDDEVAQELALQLRYHGYEVKIFNQLNEIRSYIQHEPNAIILMGADSPDNKLGNIHVMEEIQRKLVRPARVIFISEHDEVNFRLGAVRAGGVAYLTKPINSAELINRLDQITASKIQEPFRLLIVDDNPIILTYLTAILEQAGIRVTIAPEPIKLLEILSDFNPDLILMDLYLPGCNGIELTKVIRQEDGFHSIPIVYLATENDFNTQSEAMSLCGNDFLVVCNDPVHLVTAIKSRITQARSLNSLINYDGLTGLLNHTAIKEELAHEITRSNRLNSSLSLALVDIDLFKKINDTYGHAAGDRVIKSLARLLKQRLRETDIVGRYGGEEFAVIMNGTDAVSAAKVIDEIRNVFSRLLHMSHNKEFSVNFSAGISDLAHFPDAERLSEAVDKALHQAKQKGRNRVIVNTGD